LMPRIS